MSDRAPTERFTSRVENYVRYRPGYPAGVVDLVIEQTGLHPDWKVADIGSGPGNLTRCFLERGYTVVGVEPNDAMRAAGEVTMAAYPGFTSVAGTAESTTLPDRSIDLVTAGQAFHWFDPLAARAEFQRILRGPGWVTLVWNKRPTGASPVLDAWHAMLLELSPDYETVRHTDDRTDEGMSILFGEGGYRAFTLPNEQALDREAFWGRLSSSSYTPLPGEPGHREIEQRSREIFDQFQEDGVVRFPYETQIFIGALGSGTA